MDRLVRIEDIDVSTPQIIKVEGESYVRKAVPPTHQGCEGCIAEGVDPACKFLYTRVDRHGAGEISLMRMVNAHLGDCYVHADGSSYIYLSAPAAPSGGYLPDSFLPGSSIHDVTRAICR